MSRTTTPSSRIWWRSWGPGRTRSSRCPAWQPLFTQHDVALRHFRRYAPDQGARLLETGGLEIVRKGGLFHSLLLPRLARSWPRWCAGRSR